MKTPIPAYSAIVLRQLAEVERRAFEDVYCVYALYNKEANKIYVGQTEDLDARLAAHKSKRFSRSFTALHSGAWILIYQETATTRSAALKRERQLKSFRGREFIKKHIPQ